MGPVPVYVRCLARGGEDMTRRIAEALGVTREAAESYKCHYGVGAAPGLGEEHGPCGVRGGSADPSGAQAGTLNGRRMASILLGVLRPSLRSIAEEVQRSFRYALGIYRDRPVSGLWLIGGGANLVGLAEVMAELLGVPIFGASGPRLPEGIDVPPGWSNAEHARMAVSLGLALGSMDARPARSRRREAAVQTAAVSG
jgi:Tfp pilus assembly PilM family ATPase